MTSVGGIFKNIGHFFATAFEKFLVIAPAAEAKADQIEAQATAAAPGIEAVTSQIPVYGPAAVTIEQAGFMILGAVAGVIHDLGEAAKQKLLDVGLDQTAIDTAVAAYKAIPSEVKAMVKVPAPPTSAA